MKRIVRRPSPATVISCIALFVALGGVSYGVATGSIDSREIADNTIRGKDVRNNNLTTRDIRNNTIRAIDIRNKTIRGRDVADKTITDDHIVESKLTQVAGALDAARLGGLPPDAYVRAEALAVRRIEQSDLLPGFAVHAVTDFPPAYWKDASGVVHLEGNVARVSGTDPAAMFTLPPGYRPAGTARFVAAPPSEAVEPGGQAKVVEITPNGAVVSPGSVSLDGITFRAAP